jgi:hypothetical protein
MLGENGSVAWLALLALSGAACSSRNRSRGGDADADVDADADTDADADADADTDGDADGDTDADADADADAFVLDSLAIGDLGDGMDLDDHVTADRDDPIGCGKADGPGGVDNQLGTLLDGIVAGAGLDTDVDTLLADRIASGSLIHLLRIVGLDDAFQDPAVTTLAYRGEDADADPANNLGGSGVFLVLSSSLTDPLDVDTARARFDDGTLAGGDLTASGTMFPVSIPLVDGQPTIDFELRDARIRYHYTDSGLTSGELGGNVDAIDFTDALAAAVEDIPMQLVRTIVAAQSDIDEIPPGPTANPCDPDTLADDCQPGQSCEGAVCVEPVGRCDAVSLALVFTAMPAILEGIAAE